MEYNDSMILQSSRHPQLEDIRQSNVHLSLGLTTLQVPLRHIDSVRLTQYLITQADIPTPVAYMQIQLNDTIVYRNQPTTTNSHQISNTLLKTENGTDTYMIGQFSTDNAIPIDIQICNRITVTIFDGDMNDITSSITSFYATLAVFHKLKAF